MYATGGALSLSEYTTPRLAEMERRFIDTALGEADAGVGLVSGETLAAVLDRHHYLGADQREMVARLTTGGERIVAVAPCPAPARQRRLRQPAKPGRPTATP